jgi:hypothetical protein
MYGANGRLLRRRVIVTEFLLGAGAVTALGVFVTASRSTPGWLVFGLWMAGVGLNYVPLALHALALLRGGRLDTELAGADIRRELRYYTKAQFWIAVPLLFLPLALTQWAREDT